MSAMAPIDTVLDALRARGGNPRKAPCGWQARCPAHEDRNPSLSVSEGKDGRVLLKCFAGCQFDEIASALSLPPNAFFESDGGEAGFRREPVRSPRVDPLPTTDDVQEWGRGLLDNAKALERLWDLRQWSPAAVEALGVGLRVEVSGRKAIVFPVYDVAGQLVNVETYLPDPDTRNGRPKIRALAGRPRELFPAPESISGFPEDQPVFVVEGHPDAVRARSLGLAAVAVPGTNNWRPGWAARFSRFARVVVVVDADSPGREAAARIASDLSQHVDDVRVLDLHPSANDGSDLTDFAADATTDDEMASLRDLFMQMANDAQRVALTTPAESHPAVADQIDPEVSDPKVAMTLIRIADDTGMSPFIDQLGNFWVAADVAGHVETWPLTESRGGQLGSHLVMEYQRKTGRTVSRAVLTEAVDGLIARARSTNLIRDVEPRVAGAGGKVYVDLGTPDWSAVEIDADGWRIVARPPVNFRRSQIQRPLATPVLGGDLAMLRPFVNVASEDDLVLVTTFLVAALRPAGPFPLLVIGGEQGSAKSTLTRVCRQLIDPSAMETRSAPRDERDLAVSLASSRLVAYDNLSGVPDWLSDALCRVSTGGGFATRKLYTDADEQVFSSKRPLILNGIEAVVTRSDLLDRSILLDLPRIDDSQRRDEESFNAAFEAARPFITGLLFSGVSAALRHLPDVKLTPSPRMADFARWAVAAETGLGLPEGSFLRAYRGNRAEANEVALEASGLASPVRSLLDGRGGTFEGSAADLLRDLDQFAPADSQRKDWPRNAAALSKRLKRLAPNLRAAGIEYSTARSSTRRVIILRVAEGS
jgi:hypothetical protein